LFDSTKTTFAVASFKKNLMIFSALEPEPDAKTAIFFIIL
jgi:hypothetical protein